MPPEMQIPNQIHFKIRAFAKSGTGTLNDLTRLEEVGAGVAVIGRTGSAPGVPTGHRIPAQGCTLGWYAVFRWETRSRSCSPDHSHSSAHLIESSQVIQGTCL